MVGYGNINLPDDTIILYGGLTYVHNRVNLFHVKSCRATNNPNAEMGSIVKHNEYLIILGYHIPHATPLFPIPL